MKKIISITIVLSIIGLVGMGFYKQIKVGQIYVANASIATSTPTRLQQVQETIDQLTAQRKQDKSFIDETNKEIADLKSRRDTQAKIDALMIVRTQLDVEISTLDATSSKN